LFNSAAVKEVLDRIRFTEKGKTRRVEQNSWNNLARELHKSYSTKEKKKPTVPSSSEKRPPSAKEPKKRAKKKARIAKTKPRREDDDDDSIMEVYVVPEEKATGNKAQKSIKAKKGRQWESKGPEPEQEDLGRLCVAESDLGGLKRQGQMVNDTITTAYLNLLGNSYYAAGVRRSDPDFVSSLSTLSADAKKNNVTTENVWTVFTEMAVSQQSGSSRILWESDRLILIQVFRGHSQYGHWSLLVVDRTRDEDPIIVFFDSLPSYDTKTFDDLKGLLSMTPGGHAKTREMLHGLRHIHVVHCCFVRPRACWQGTAFRFTKKSGQNDS
jgi:hypothetical protein